MSETRPLKELFDEAMKGQWITKERRSPSKNSRLKKRAKTGFLSVTRVYCRECKQGFMYAYRQVDTRGRVTTLRSVDFLILRKKVCERNFKWEIDDKIEARKTAKEVGLPLIDLI